MKLISLYELLTITFKEKNYWDYYYHNYYNPINNPKDIVNFIYDFYISGEKKGLYMGDENDLEGDFENHLHHTIVVFFLGIAIKKNFFESLDIIDGNDKFDFSYIWYLTALYHDYGYRIEDIENDILGIVNGNAYFNNYNRYYYYKRKQWGVKKLCPNFSSKIGVCERYIFTNNVKKENLRKLEWCRFQCKGNIKFSNGIMVEKEQYSASIKHRYFFYRINVHRKYDHGIIGGDILFSRLYENYLKKYDQLKLYNAENDFTDFCFNNLHFSCKQFKIFSYIGDCIAAHNIWKCPENCEALYRDYQLEQLIGENFKKINFSNNPLLFLLCLCDSIEPSKYFSEENNYMQKLFIGIDVIEKSIELDFSEIESKISCQKYMVSILSLTDWMLCKIKVINEQRIKIYILL